MAAPTAGLHFTPAMREKLADRGFEWAEVTLYVGYGTFSPVRCEDIRSHRMHREYVEVPEATGRGHSPGPRPRAVPWWPWAPPACVPWRAWPNSAAGAALHGLDGHFSLSRQELPRGGRGADQFSSAGILPCSCWFRPLPGASACWAAYAEAVTRGYRFFSYGDAMLIK